MKPIRSLAANRRSRQGTRDGVAALELAVAAPVLLLLLLGTADLALWIRGVFRLDELTTQMGQIITQCPVLNDPADFTVLFADARRLAGPIDVTSRTGGAFIVSAMGITNGRPTVLWQRSIGNPTFNSRFGAVNATPATGAYTVVAGGVLIGTEAFSGIQPWNLAATLMRGSTASPQIYSQSMFLVRSTSPTQLAVLGSAGQAGCSP